MEGYVLLIIGVLFIFISVIFILESNKNINLIYEDIVKKHGEIKEYVRTIEKLVYDLDEIVDKSLLKIDLIENNNQKNDSIRNSNKFIESSKDINISEEDDENKINNNSYNEILKFKKLGYKNNTIAKKLNKGIREIEIILKMNGYNKR